MFITGLQWRHHFIIEFLQVFIYDELLLRLDQVIKRLDIYLLGQLVLQYFDVLVQLVDAGHALLVHGAHGGEHFIGFGEFFLVFGFVDEELVEFITAALDFTIHLLKGNIAVGEEIMYLSDTFIQFR